jgi:hypothetical protein
MFFSGLLLRTAIGFGAVTYALVESFFNYGMLKSGHYIFVRFTSLNQGTPKAAFYFLPAVSRSQYFSPLHEATLRSRPGGCSIAATRTALLTINLRYRYGILNRQGFMEDVFKLQTELLCLEK